MEMNKNKSRSFYTATSLCSSLFCSVPLFYRNLKPPPSLSLSLPQKFAHEVSHKGDASVLLYHTTRRSKNCFTRHVRYPSPFIVLFVPVQSKLRVLYTISLKTLLRTSQDSLSTLLCLYTLMYYRQVKGSYFIPTEYKRQNYSFVQVTGILR